MTDNTDARFNAIMDNVAMEVAQDLENQALIRLLESGLKAAHICAAVHKEAREKGLPRELAESMAADLWHIMILPFVPEGDDTLDDDTTPDK